jgi:hypothetical protein
MINVNNSKKCKAVNKHGAIYKEDFNNIKENMKNLDNKYYENLNNFRDENNKYAYKEKQDENTYNQNHYLVNNYKYGDNLQDGYFRQQLVKKDAAAAITSKMLGRRIFKPITLNGRRRR